MESTFKNFKLFIFYIAWLELPSVTGTCSSFPSTWDSAWYDSSYGSVTFTASTGSVSGYSVTAYASTVTSWTCQYEDTTNNYLVFRGDTTVDLFGAPQYAYLCFQWTKVTDYSYHYYLHADTEINAGNTRVLIIDAGSTQPSAASGYCSPTSGPSVEEFIMLVKQGQESNVKTTCPTLLQSIFSYTSNDGSTTTCGSSANLDVCTDTTTLTYNLTLCSTVQAFSQEGVVYCVSSVSSGSNYFLFVLNPGTVDNTNYFRFTCFAAATSGSGVSVSQNPDGCESGQSPTVRTTNGILNALTVDSECPSSTSTTTTTASSGISLAAIIGAIIGLLLLILGIIIIVVICKKKKRKKKEQVGIHEREHSDLPRKEEDTMVIEALTPRDALTVNPDESAAKTRLSPIDPPSSAAYVPPLPPINTVTKQNF